MMCKNFKFIIFLAGILSSCSIAADIGNTVKGSYFMETGNYRQAEIDFKEAVLKHPDSAIAQYYLGRFLLAQNKATEALPHFQKSVFFDSGDADYFFWLGVTYGELGNNKAEKKNYELALQLNGRHPQAHLYLGHQQLKNGELQQALKSYDAVLREMPTDATALYNKALILDIEKKDVAAEMAWLEYLKWHPAGQYALQATDHLNALGNFSYENHFLGRRTVTLAEIKFQSPGSSVSQSSLPSLQLVGAIVSNLQKGNLQIVVYVHHHKQRAKERAIAIKNTLHELFSTIAPGRIHVSWFATPETFTQGKKALNRNESVRFFLTGWK